MVAAVAFVLACLPAIPMVMLAVECFAAVCGRPPCAGRTPPPDEETPSTVVLIPAHDEETEIAATLDSCLAQADPALRLLVVAHNCRDRTAEIARERGVDVVEAGDDGTDGKPAAMRHGLRALAEDPPRVVITLDADCQVSPGGLAALARTAHRTGRPTQATYLFEGPGGVAGVQGVSRLAVLVKNRVRPLGLLRLGLPCALNGSGSAFPATLLDDVLAGEGGIAEDRQYSVDLALRGHPPLYLPEVEVWSRLPEARGTAYEQRRRWEHGNLRVVFHGAPLLLLAGLRRFRPSLFLFGLDMLIPPLASLLLLWAVTAVAAGGAWFGTGEWLPLVPVVGALVLLGLGIVAASLRFEGPAQTARTIGWIPLYVAWKVPLYLAYIRRREKRWIRTARDGAESPVDPVERNKE